MSNNIHKSYLERVMCHFNLLRAVVEKQKMGRNYLKNSYTQILKYL